MHCSPRLLRYTALAALLGALLTGCGPEAGRARGGGMGADVGNHPANFHPRSKLFSGEGTP
jgi:hypothetical protein